MIAAATSTATLRSGWGSPAPPVPPAGRSSPSTCHARCWLASSRSCCSSRRGGCGGRGRKLQVEFPRMKTLLDVLTGDARDGLALAVPGGPRYSYRQLESEVRRLADELAGFGA